jgi:hypothetical protein
MMNNLEMQELLAMRNMQDQIDRGVIPNEKEPQEPPHLVAERAFLNKLRDDYSSAFFSMDLATVPNGGLLTFDGIHLSNAFDIASFYIENSGTTAKVQVYMGSGGGGLQACNPVKPGQYVKGRLPNGIKSISLVSTGTDTGLVICVVTARPWAPARGSM